ncbi:MAG TPA: anti-sigma factor [Acidimicrobiales bacterium]|nr:anti-sigma factor [Acidimicrobiales bacterium]
MDHAEIESLLGAYALDAVDEDEAEEIERHLPTCPRCRAEVANHREMAALLGNAGGEAPPELWDRISATLGGDAGDLEARPEPRPPALIVPIDRARERRGQRNRLGARAAVSAGAAAAVAAVTVLGFQVAHLDSRVQGLQSAISSGSVSQAALATEMGRHQQVSLTSAVAGGTDEAQVIVGQDGSAYVVSSNMPGVASDKTYQVWALVKGKPVSIGVVGPSAPSSASIWTFKVQPGMTRIMVTVEPEGGTPAPTTPVLVQSPINFT